MSAGTLGLLRTSRSSSFLSSSIQSSSVSELIGPVPTSACAVGDSLVSANIRIATEKATSQNSIEAVKAVIVTSIAAKRPASFLATLFPSPLLPPLPPPLLSLLFLLPNPDKSAFFDLPCTNAP